MGIDKLKANPAAGLKVLCRPCSLTWVGGNEDRLSYFTTLDVLLSWPGKWNQSKNSINIYFLSYCVSWVVLLAVAVTKDKTGKASLFMELKDRQIEK